MVLVGVHADKYIANKLIDVAVVNSALGKYVMPVPSAFVFQPAKVRPVFTRFPVLLAARRVFPPIPVKELGTVPELLPFAT